MLSKSLAYNERKILQCDSFYEYRPRCFDLTSPKCLLKSYPMFLIKSGIAQSICMQLGQTES